MTANVSLSTHHARLSGIEAARGIAATMVVFYHTARHLKVDYGVMPWVGFAQFGHAGVDFFFVLSGFIIFFVHQKDLDRRDRLFAYFERRFTRIYPMFWFSLVIGLLLALMSSSHKFPSLSFILHSATLLPFGADIGVAWTLNHEVLFYLIFATALINRRAGFIVFACWLGFICMSWAMGYAPKHSPVLLCLASVLNLQFFLGIFVAYIVKQHVVKHNGMILTAGIAMFCGVALAEDIGAFNGYAPSGQMAYGLSSMLIILATANGNMNGQFQAPTPLVQLGTASYSIYLLHLPCIGVIYKLLSVSGLRSHIPLDLLYILLVSGAIAISVVISKFVERPLMNLVRRFIKSLLAYCQAKTPAFKAQNSTQLQKDDGVVEQ
jgi:peptidoglycan/LPS O-acetylase OafA/YrhL